ncbi:hypothetical protein [Neisseria yangbaofengii]|uniref:hypothetical protein n=1 Tax=Neisseria yangbaofengii TaxID=2709396 RepID=UPI0013EAB26F|nr:hypothetical protein [Neisseria yangbaofengii]
MLISAKCRVLVVNRNVTLILVLPGLAMIWAAQIQTVALPMFVVAVVIEVGHKRIDYVLVGQRVGSITKQYSGDRLY